MYKNFLIPTDGSQLSEVAIYKGIQLAKTVNAKVTGLYVMPEFHVLTYKTEMLEDTKEQFLKDSKLHAEKYLSVIERIGKELDVATDVLSVTNDHIYEAIVQTAIDRQCDLITMASHGRSGIKAIILGSQTQKVLIHSKIPVLVFR